MPPQRFETVLRSDEGSAVFLEVPAETIAALDRGKRPPVRVTLHGHLYQTTIATYGGKYYLPVRKGIREAARLTPGEPVMVTLELDDEPRVVEVPDELSRALAADPEAQAAFDRLSYTHAISRQTRGLVPCSSTRKRTTSAWVGMSTSCRFPRLRSCDLPSVVTICHQWAMIPREPTTPVGWLATSSAIQCKHLSLSNLMASVRRKGARTEWCSSPREPWEPFEPTGWPGVTGGSLGTRDPFPPSLGTTPRPGQGAGTCHSGGALHHRAAT